MSKVMESQESKNGKAFSGHWKSRLHLYLSGSPDLHFPVCKRTSCYSGNRAS